MARVLLMLRLFVVSTWIKPIVSDLANVESVSVSDRTENEVTLEWSKVHNISSYVLRFDDMEMFINGSDNASVIRHTLSSLSPGRIYYYSLHTVSDTRQSYGYHSYAFTAPVNVDNVTIQYQDDVNVVLKFSDTNVLNRNRHYYILKYGAIETYIGRRNDAVYPYFGFHHHDPYFNRYYDPFFNHQYEDTYKVTSLSPGTKYNFTLYSVFYGMKSRGYNISAETTPAKVTCLHCEYSWLGSVVTLVWDAPHGLWSEFEVQVNEGNPKHVNITRYQIDDVLSSVQYEVSVTSLSGKLRSDPVSAVCQTNASGAIAGSILVVFLLVSVGIFCKHKKCELRRCFFGKPGNVKKTSNLPMDLIYVNTSTHNTQENQDSSVKSENKDISEVNHPYEVLN